MKLIVSLPDGIKYTVIVCTVRRYHGENFGPRRTTRLDVTVPVLYRTLQFGARTVNTGRDAEVIFLYVREKKEKVL